MPATTGVNAGGGRVELGDARLGWNWELEIQTESLSWVTERHLRESPWLPSRSHFSRRQRLVVRARFWTQTLCCYDLGILISVLIARLNMSLPANIFIQAPCLLWNCGGHTWFSCAALFVSRHKNSCSTGRESEHARWRFGSIKIQRDLTSVAHVKEADLVFVRFVCFTYKCKT